ncbi:hypothetical protein [Sporofaciens musculi]|nr:hypothetical protein [Sporofaciens musculi]
MGMYLALPGQAAGGEKIVDILSPEEIETVEVYCSMQPRPRTEGCRDPYGGPEHGFPVR